MHPNFESLSRFALREASAAEAREVEAHLQDCPDCRREAREIALMELGLRSAAAEPATEVSCPGSAQWAAFADGALGEADRAALDQHLLACDDCLHRVLLVLRTREASAPAPLLEQARALGASSGVPRRETWLALPVTLPRWAVLGLSAAGVAFLALFLRGAMAPLPVAQFVQPPKSPEPNQQQLWEQLAALKPENGRVILLAVTPGLQDSLSAYQKKPERDEQRRLLEQLQKLEPSLPARQIQSVQLKSSPQAKAGSWLVLQWKESRLEIVPIRAGENSP